MRSSPSEEQIVQWERAYRQADTVEKRDWIVAEADRRKQGTAALCGLIRSTYIHSVVSAANPKAATIE